MPAVKDRLKILMIAPTPYFADRGCHVRIYEEARALRSIGHDVRIVTYHIGRDMAGIPTERIVKIPWYKKLSAGPSWHKLYLDVLLFFKAWQVARDFCPDVLHAHLHEGAFLGAFLKKFLKVPMVFDYQGSLSGEMEDHGYLNKGSLLYRLFASLENFIHRQSDVIVVSSGQSAKLLCTEWAISETKLAKVIDAVDTEFFSPVGAAELKLKLNLPSGLPVVVFTGILSSYQGIDLLLESAAFLKKSRVNIHFLVVGFPEEQYCQRALDMGIDDLITFTGKVPYDEIPNYLGVGDIAVSPKISTTEANLKLFNYMACGLPTVVFEAEVNREILEDSGVYAKFGDSEDLAKVLEVLSQDKVRMAELAAKARNDAVSRHSWTSRATNLEELYIKLVGC
jgi:glycosyltransferase involved in cell wall biosynthesis